MAEQEAIGLLEQLARDFNVRDPRKLFQIARREFPDRRDLTSARAAAALRGDVARQILAPKPRSLGKSAAEGPNDRLQADLVDFSQNTRGRNKYGLVVQDVFTREIATKALPDKRAETVTRAAAEIIPDLVQEEGNYVVTTDLGNEFQGLEAALPGGAVHRQKDPSDRNATAVVDRAIQTLKKDLAGMVARRGGGWGEHVDEAAEAYNARPHQAVTVAPEDVETMPTATFRVYQDNATKFQHNKKLTEGRKRRLEEAGAFRAPTNARRSFKPQYGPAREIASIDSMVVRATDGTETLLKHALPVPRGSAEPKAKLTRPPVSTCKAIMCKRLPKSAWWPCLISGRYNGHGGVDNVPSEQKHMSGTAPWALCFCRQCFKRVEGFLDERSMHRSQPFHATSLSTWNLDFHRRLAKSSNRTTSRHAKHGRKTEPCYKTSERNKTKENRKVALWCGGLAPFRRIFRSSSPQTPTLPGRIMAQKFLHGLCAHFRAF